MASRWRTWDMEFLDSTLASGLENGDLEFITAVPVGKDRGFKNLSLSSIVLPKAALSNDRAFDEEKSSRPCGRGRSLKTRALSYSKPGSLRRPGEKDQRDGTRLGLKFLGSEYLYEELFPGLGDSNSKNTTKPPVASPLVSSVWGKVIQSTQPAKPTINFAMINSQLKSASSNHESSKASLRSCEKHNSGSFKDISHPSPKSGSLRNSSRQTSQNVNPQQNCSSTDNVSTRPPPSKNVNFRQIRSSWKYTPKPSNSYTKSGIRSCVEAVERSTGNDSTPSQAAQKSATVCERKQLQNSKEQSQDFVVSTTKDRATTTASCKPLDDENVCLNTQDIDRQTSKQSGESIIGEGVKEVDQKLQDQKSGDICGVTETNEELSRNKLVIKSADSYSDHSVKSSTQMSENVVTNPIERSDRGACYDKSIADAFDGHFQDDEPLSHLDISSLVIHEEGEPLTHSDGVAQEVHEEVGEPRLVNDTSQIVHEEETPPDHTNETSKTDAEEAKASTNSHHTTQGIKEKMELASHLELDTSCQVVHEVIKLQSQSDDTCQAFEEDEPWNHSVDTRQENSASPLGEDSIATDIPMTDIFGESIKVSNSGTNGNTERSKVAVLISSHTESSPTETLGNLLEDSEAESDKNESIRYQNKLAEVVDYDAVNERVPDNQHDLPSDMSLLSRYKEASENNHSTSLDMQSDNYCDHADADEVEELSHPKDTKHSGLDPAVIDDFNPSHDNDHIRKADDYALSQHDNLLVPEEVNQLVDDKQPTHEGNNSLVIDGDNVQRSAGIEQSKYQDENLIDDVEQSVGDLTFCQEQNNFSIDDDDDDGGHLIIQTDDNRSTQIGDNSILDGQVTRSVNHSQSTKQEVSDTDDDVGESISDHLSAKEIDSSSKTDAVKILIDCDYSIHQDSPSVTEDMERSDNNYRSIEQDKHRKPGITDDVKQVADTHQSCCQSDTSSFLTLSDLKLSASSLDNSKLNERIVETNDKYKNENEGILESLEQESDDSEGEITAEPCDVRLENLPLTITEEELLEVIEPYGSALSLVFVEDTSFKSCTVRMADSIGGELLAASLDGLEIDGYRMRTSLDVAQV